MKRRSGVLMHISSLPGGYGCGSFGSEAKKFIDIISSAGFSYWQTLPFCVPDQYNSPYSSYSAFSGNPYFIDLPTLRIKGYISDRELNSAREASPYACEFARLNKERMQLLRLAAEHALKSSELMHKIDEFHEKNPHTASFCRFMAMKEKNGGLPFYEWKDDSFNTEDELMWRFIQYEFFTQWEQIKSYANGKGISVIGDIPIYVARDSSDLWSCGDQFLLDSDGRPQWVAGVPPDYFSADGQLWGNPLYDWDKMKSDGFSFWRQRLSFMLRCFDGVRIDHFRAIESYYAIPGTARTAKEGKWRKGPGRDFIDMIKQTAAEEKHASEGEKLIIAEDLGDITDEVRELLAYSGFPGMRVLQFGFISRGDSLHRPHNYKDNCVAYTGTHDNNTLLGHIWETPPERRADLFDYCGCGSDWNSAREQIVRTVMMSSAGTVMLPIQDILGYGADTRMNTPGVAEKNWSFRLSSEQLTSFDIGKYRRMNELSARI